MVFGTFGIESRDELDELRNEAEKEICENIFKKIENMSLEELFDAFDLVANKKVKFIEVTHCFFGGLPTLETEEKMLIEELDRRGYNIESY